MAKATINQQLERLEKIAADLKNEYLGLEEALKLYEEGMEYEQQYCREETIASVYKLVYETEDGRIRIYET